MSFLIKSISRVISPFDEIFVSNYSAPLSSNFLFPSGYVIFNLVTLECGDERLSLKEIIS